VNTDFNLSQKLDAVHFLPMCFFFVGSALSNVQREIRELRAQLSAQAGATP